MKINKLFVVLCVLFFQNQIFCADKTRCSIESLVEMASNGDKSSCEILAQHYYYQEKCYKKAMYWIFKGVEIGSSECMYILRNAYGKGCGVIDDVEEGLKWLLLAASLGHEKAGQELKKIKELRSIIPIVCPEKDIEKVVNQHEKCLEEARRRAREWMRFHQNLFIGLD